MRTRQLGYSWVLLLSSLVAGCGDGSATDDGGSSPVGAGGDAGTSAGGGAGKAGAAGKSSAGASGAGHAGTGGAGAGGASGGSGGGAAGQGGAGGAASQGGAGGAASQGGAAGGGAAGKGGAGAGGGGGGGGGAGGKAGTGGVSGGGQGGGGQSQGGAGAGGCSPACGAGQTCLDGVCVTSQGACQDNTQCKYDTHCVGGECIPYKDGENDPACLFVAAPEVLAPEVKCEFTTPPAGDLYPNHVNVEATPMVANLGYDSPSIVAPFQGATNGVSCGFEDCNYRFGVIRILSGKTCEQQAVIGGTDLDGDGIPEWARSSSPVALADLDGDKVPEIIAYMVEQYNPATQQGNETIVAFTRMGDAWIPFWPNAVATNQDGTPFNAAVPVSGASGADWAGPSVHDLDDDGVPEIIREGYVIDGLTGVVKTGLPPGYATYSTGTAAVLANIDNDPQIELTNGAYVWEYNQTTKAWDLDPAYANPGSTPAGWTAVADFNPYDGLGTAEIVVASSGTLTIFTAAHEVFAGTSVKLPAAGGGPPTVADFDGDGLPEVGIATSDYYVVIDPDCQGTPRPGGKCESRDQCEHAPGGACPDYILWSRTSQDHSSQITGSSVFDFEADGKAEVIYADECFARVYSGSNGRVLFSLYHSSSTWQENPVIADTDGDFRADLVVVSNGNFSKGSCAELLDASGVETHFAGTICEKDADCISGTCDAGLCRCTSSQQCCSGAASDDACIELGRQCAPPPAGTAGTGNTCRASFPHGSVGIRVYKDSRDRWVESRPIWNQHAYSVTNVGDDGSIPKTSAWAKNWSDLSQNNYRQNSHGAAQQGQIPDLTAKASPSATCYLDNGTTATLQVDVCNRGTAPVGNNLLVDFYTGDTQICTGSIVESIAPGACATAYCTWENPPKSKDQAMDVRVVPNDGGDKSECDSLNNEGLVKGVYCVQKP